MNAPVHALTVFDDGSGPSLYAGGEFTSAGGVAALGLARWEGSSWQTLAGAASDVLRDPVLYALTVFDDGAGPALCVGGSFEVSPAGDANLARWGNGKTVGPRQKP